MSSAKLAGSTNLGTIVVIALALSVLAPCAPAFVLHNTVRAQVASRPLTPTLLRRVAEAVEGHRTGGPVWVTVQYEFPNVVIDVRPSREAAQADSASLSMEQIRALGPVGVLGPFQAHVDPEGLSEPIPPARPLSPSVEIPRIRPPGCVHDGYTSVMRRLGGVGICPDRWIAGELVAQIELTYRLTNGNVITAPVPREVDAIFLTLPALDKFVFPYYARVLGMAESLKMRRLVVQEMQIQ